MGPVGDFLDSLLHSFFGPNLQACDSPIMLHQFVKHGQVSTTRTWTLVRGFWETYDLDRVLRNLGFATAIGDL